MRALLCITTLVVASGCASVSYRTLEDAENALLNSALSAEEEADTREWIERFERTVERAEKHYMIRAACLRTASFTWVCNGQERYNPDKPPQTLEELAWTYRNDRGTCGCMKSDEAVQWASQ